MAGYVVQTVAGSVTAGSVVTLALPAATRAGDCLIVTTQNQYSTTNGTVQSVTLGGVGADNFFQAASISGPVNLAWWCDPSCTGGGTSVAVTVSGGSGATFYIGAGVIEAGGVWPVAARLVDASATHSGSATAYNSGTAITNMANEIAVAQVAGRATTLTAPGYPWMTFEAVGPVTANNYIALAGWAGEPNAGTTVAYAGGHFGSASSYSAGVVVFSTLPAAPLLPNLVAGQGVQQGDITSLVTSPLGFAQQRTIFRCAQTASTTTIPANGASATTIVFDTVYEDEYQGFDANTGGWLAPLSAYYHVTLEVATGAADAGTILTLAIAQNTSAFNPVASVVIPSGGGICQANAYIFATGGQDEIFGQAFVTNCSSNVATSSSTPCTMEITWMLGS